MKKEIIKRNQVIKSYCKFFNAYYQIIEHRFKYTIVCFTRISGKRMFKKIYEDGTMEEYNPR